MKKIVYSAAIICLVMAAVSCKSTKAEKKAKKKAKNAAAVEAPAEAQAAPVAAEGGEVLAADPAAPAAPATGSESAAATATTAGTAPAAAANASSEAGSEAAEDKDFTGWIKGSRKNIKERYGKLQIKIKSGIGSYTIAALNEKDKPVPVLSTANEYVTNAFYLKTNRKIYNLVTDNNVKSSARQTTDGAVINYEIPSVAQISVYFSCFASQKKKEADMIKVTATIKNISNRNDDFSFKALLDTVLGEAAAFHFYTWEDIPVKNEVLYRTLQNQKWFVSKNIYGAMQLFFTGAEATPPELVALANYSTFEKNSWEPDMLNYRVFDTVLSYNNSGVCAIWKPMKLAPTESGKIVFYMALSGDGTPASGEKYVYSKQFKDKSEEEKDGKSASGLEVITPFSVEGEEAEEVSGVTEFTGLVEKVSETPETPAEIPNVDFYIKNMTKEHLTPEYIQSLLDRIAALEEDSPSLNRQELLQLNAELDAILTYLRQ